MFPTAVLPMSINKDVNMCFAHEWRVINSSLTQVTIAETQVITQVTITAPCLVYRCHCLFSGEESILSLISQVLIFFFPYITTTYFNFSITAA